MTLEQEDEVRLAEHAARWFGLLQEDESARGPCFAWLAESPRHVEAFLSMLALAQEIAALSPDTLTQLKGLESDVQTLGATGTNIVSLDAAVEAGGEIDPVQYPATPATLRRSRRWTFGAGLAASVLLVAAGWLAIGAGWRTYTTAVGEQRTIGLADGSIVYLNTDSRLKVRLTDRERTLRLVEGQALFEVERDASRPFVVRSGNTAIQAIGTQFDVYRRATQTRVAVIEGAVQISDSGSAEKIPDKLAAGETAEVAAGGEITRRERLDVAKVTSWRQRRLVFREDTLEDIAAEFNRYNTSVQIKVIGNIARAEHFSGTFEADAPETLVQALARDETLLIEHANGEIVIRGKF